MMELWTEDDGSFKTYTINPSLKAKVTIAGVETEVGISGSIQFQAGDDNIGTVYVQYCDPWFNYWGYEYVVAGPSGDVFFAQRDRGY